MTLDTVALDRDGWTAIPRVLTPDDAAALATRCHGLLDNPRRRRMNDKAASGTTRATELFDRLPELRARLDVPAVRATVEHLLGGAAALHDATLRIAMPGFGHQGLHSDGLPTKVGACDGVTCIIALCAFTKANGSTAVISGSHVWPQKVKQSNGPHRSEQAEDRLLGPAGTAFVFSMQLLHRGTRNESSTPRPALQVFWKRA